MKKRITLLLSCSAILLSGCLSPGSTPKTTFYQLRSSNPAPEAIITMDEDMIVGPIELSPYLDTPKLVFRPTRQQVAYRELHRWAEPLEQNLANVMASDLSSLLNSKRTYAYSPRVGLREGVFSIRMRVHRFEINEEGKAVMDISAVLLKGTEAVLNPILHLELSTSVAESGREAEVAALNDLTHQLSMALAREVQKTLSSKTETP